MTQFSKAKWIGFGNGNLLTGIKTPPKEFRRKFTLGKAPENAECLISGLGFFTLYVNGKRVSDDLLCPAFTAYDKRALFMRYDLKDYLAAGDNVIAVKVGAGFLNDSTANSWDLAKAPWRSAEKLLFELVSAQKNGIARFRTLEFAVSHGGIEIYLRKSLYKCNQGLAIADFDILMLRLVVGMHAFGLKHRLARNRFESDGHL